MINWLYDWLIDWLIDWFMDGWVDGLTDWWVGIWIIRWMNGTMDEWLNGHYVFCGSSEMYFPLHKMHGRRTVFPVTWIAENSRTNKCHINHYNFKFWSERENQQDATVRCLFLKISQHVSGIIMPIFRRTRRLVLLRMGIMMPETCWELLRINIKLLHLVGFLSHFTIYSRCTVTET